METAENSIPEIVENKKFCNLSAKAIDPNKIDSVLEIICKQWDFDLSVPIDRICANRALVLSVIFN